MTHTDAQDESTPYRQKAVWLWVAYDFANSLGNITLSFYFTLWFVADMGASSIWVSVPVALSTIVLFFTLPAFGSFSDRIGRRMPFLRLATLCAIGMLFALGIVATRASTLTLSTIALVAVIYFLYQYFYQAALAFYNPFLVDLAGVRSREKISGIGTAAGSIGNMVGLLLVLPIANGTAVFAGLHGRPATFIVASLLFLLCSLPTLLFLKDKQGSKTIAGSKAILGQSVRNALRDLRSLYQYRTPFRYLIGYYFFADASLTVLLFGSLYLEKVGGFSDAAKTFIGAASVLCTALGALASGRIAKAAGGTKQGIVTCTAVLAVLLAVFAFSFHRILFVSMALLNGVAFGVLFSLSRAYYSRIIPRDEQAKFFGVYVLFERFASVLGPLVWSGSILVFGFLGEAFSYRMAMFALGMLVAVSFSILRHIKEPEGVQFLATPL